MLSRRKQNFLKERLHKIADLTLHCPDEDFFNLQSVDARVTHIEEQGDLWLAVNPPADCLQNTISSFDVVLSYQQKGGDFNMDILGEASMYNGSEEEARLLPSKTRKEFIKGKLLLQVHIIDIDYRRHGNSILKNAAQKMRQFFATNVVDEEDKEPAYSNH